MSPAEREQYRWFRLGYLAHRQLICFKDPPKLITERCMKNCYRLAGDIEERYPEKK